MDTGCCYHIYNRGINKQPIFFEEENYVYFLQQFKKYLGAYVKVFAYCLMPNHFHFFLRIDHQAPLNSKVANLNTVEKAFKDFFISYSKAINKKYNRTGGLFQYKFKRKAVEDIKHYNWLTYYIHNNPVKAGLCTRPGDWKFSSYNAYIFDKETLVAREEIIERLVEKKSLSLFTMEIVFPRMSTGFLKSNMTVKITKVLETFVISSRIRARWRNYKSF